jgi:hypothetical protein
MVDFPYYIEAVLWMLAIIPIFLFPVIRLTRYARHKKFRKQVRQFNLVFWIDMLLTGILRLSMAIDPRGVFQILSLEYRLMCFEIAQLGLGVTGVEWTIGIIRVALIIDNFSVLQSCALDPFRVLKVVFNIGMIISAVIAIYHIFLNDNNHYFFTLQLYLTCLLFISLVMQIVAIRNLYKFNLDWMKLQNSSTSFMLSKLEKDFKAPVSRLILTTITSFILFVALLICNIYLTFQSGNRGELFKSILGGNPDKYSVGIWLILGISVVAIFNFMGMFLSWVVPDESEQSTVDKFACKICETALKNTWVFIGRRLFPQISEPTANQAQNRDSFQKVDLSRTSTSTALNSDLLKNSRSYPLLRD